MEEENEIRVFSANKCGFLLCHNIEPLRAEIDNESGKSYLVFEINDQVQGILDKYSRPDNTYDLAIFSFIRNYKISRQLMQNAYQEEN